jgi:hypothetical protein
VTVSDDGLPLSRILEPSDPWSGECTRAERAANFQGKYDAISVTDQTGCHPLRALAVFYGIRGGTGPLEPAYAVFTELEVHQAGGQLTDTDADPPWPDDYNAAHRDIIGDLPRVADYFAELLPTDSRRSVFVTRPDMLAEMCKILREQPANAKFTDRVKKRMRDLFRDERPLWDQLAAEHPYLSDDPVIQRELRKEEQANRSKKGSSHATKRPGA